MVGLKTAQRKRIQASMDAGPLNRETVKRQISLAAGTEAFHDRDPIFHLTESFRQTFDQTGMARARGASLRSMTDPRPMEETPGLPDDGGVGSFREAEDDERSEKTDMTPFYRPRDPQKRLMDRFAEVTFQRGTLSAAVLRGQGKMMLFSCLKRAAGQEQSRQTRERMLFQAGSSHKRIPGRQGDLAVVNKGFSDSAVGLVVDVLKDARQALDSFAAVAEGRAGAAGKGTIEKEYPFLTDARERELLAEYQARLAKLKGPGHDEERAVLTRAQEKTEAVLQKKEQMKRDFLQKLRWLAECAAAAEEEFASEEFRREAAKQLEPEEPEDLPPPDDSGGGDDPDGSADAPRKKRRRKP